MSDTATDKIKGSKIGVVESDKTDKTRKVVVSFLAKHPKYGKYIRRRTVLQVHDEANVSRKGDKVEQYTIKSQIGSGGTSVVFKAVDELLGQTVAIKQFLHTGEAGGDTLREKIRIEAKLHKEATSDRKSVV